MKVHMASDYFLLLVLVGAASVSGANAENELCTDFYSCSCPNLLPIVKKGVIRAIQNEARIGASLLRLHFHDCFVNGCDASILLDDTSNFIGEQTAAANNRSARGFNVIDDIKSDVEKQCPGVVSCVDILALAARDSVVYLGGPSWEVGLGRRDSTTASRSDANNSIPAPSLNLNALITNFANQGLSVTDLVALSGAHTIGLAQCRNFRAHIYNDSNVDPSYRRFLQSKCPRSGNDNVLEPLDHQTAIHFDNLYFKNLVSKKVLLHSDQELFNGSSVTDNLVRKYATDSAAFFKDFAQGMVRMSNIKPLTGSTGLVTGNYPYAVAQTLFSGEFPFYLDHFNRVPTQIDQKRPFQFHPYKLVFYNNKLHEHEEIHNHGSSSMHYGHLHLNPQSAREACLSSFGRKVLVDV